MTEMDAYEALIYCLGWTAEDVEDGEYHSEPVWDANNERHWIAWGDESQTPRFCSDSPTPFAIYLSPYSTSKKKGDELP